MFFSYITETFKLVELHYAEAHTGKDSMQTSTCPYSKEEGGNKNIRWDVSPFVKVSQAQKYRD